MAIWYHASWLLFLVCAHYTIYNHHPIVFLPSFSAYILYYLVCLRPPQEIVKRDPPKAIGTSYEYYVPLFQKKLVFQKNVLIPTCSLMDLHKKPVKNIKFQLAFTYQGKTYSFPVSRQSLMLRYSSYLYELFAKHVDRSQIMFHLHRDLENHPPCVVAYILSFLAEKNTDVKFPANETERDLWMKEARFFGCPQLISLWSNKEEDIYCITWEDWLMQQHEAHVYARKNRSHPLFVLDPVFSVHVALFQQSYPELVSDSSAHVLGDTVTDTMRLLHKAIHKRRHAFYGKLNADSNPVTQLENEETGQIENTLKDQKHEMKKSEVIPSIKPVGSRRFFSAATVRTNLHVRLEKLLKLVSTLPDDWRGRVYFSGTLIENQLIQPQHQTISADSMNLVLYVTGSNPDDFLKLIQQRFDESNCPYFIENRTSSFASIFNGIHPFRVDRRRYTDVEEYFAHQGVDPKCVTFHVGTEQLLFNTRAFVAHATRHFCIYLLKDLQYKETAEEYYFKQGYSVFVPGLQDTRYNKDFLHRETQTTPLQLIDFFAVSSDIRDTKPCSGEQIAQWKRQQDYLGQNFYHLAYTRE